MSDTATSIAIIASNFFGLPIECVSEYDGGVQYRITSPVFGKGRGVSLLITRPYRQKYSAIAIFDTFSTQLINVWKAMDDEVLTCAAQYLESYADRLSVDIDIREHQLNSAEGIAQAMRELRTPADFFLRVSATIQGDELKALCEITQCAYGFLLFISGAISDDAAEKEKDGELEGAIRQVSSTRYERSTRNRMLCIAAKGTSCAVCGFDFEKAYGAFAAGYIEVHHKTPVSQLGESTAIDPIEDLVPLCPNCHAAVHMSNPPLMPEKLKAMMETRI